MIDNTIDIKAFWIPGPLKLEVHNVRYNSLQHAMLIIFNINMHSKGAVFTRLIT